MNSKKKLIFAIIVLVIVVIVVSIFGLYDKCLKFMYPTVYSEYVEKYSEKYNIEKEWIYALIKAESNFNRNSVSQSGAIGLMQLMENTAIEVSNQVRC